MSLKSIVKKYSPDFLLPVLRVPYRVAAWPYRTVKRYICYMIAHRALKYLPYYQDKLSREILKDRIEFLKSGNPDIFLKRAIMAGWDFRHLLYDFVEHYTMAEGKYTCITVVYGKKCRELEYTRTLLRVSRKPNSYRIVSLRDFMKGLDIAEDELIVAIRCEKNVKKYMAEKNLHNNIFGWLVAVRIEEQYFDVFQPADGEIVVQAGCYDGATVVRFLNWGKGRIKRVYSFEPDPKNFEVCTTNLRVYDDKVILINKGLWNKDETIYANPTGSGGSSVLSKGNTELHLTSIDNAIKNEAVTLIQLDIEGAELKTLEGAKDTIIKNHPKLAISLYHKFSDIYEIPSYILSLVPEYKFILRNYTTREWDTVLYAYCE